MFNNFWISFFLAAGASGWIYAKMQKYTSHQTKVSLTVAIISALVILLIFTSILDSIFKK